MVKPTKPLTSETGARITACFCSTQNQQYKNYYEISRGYFRNHIPNAVACSIRSGSVLNAGGNREGRSAC
jgi:hypothetical protein